MADTVTADKTHRGHAIIEQVRADHKHAALAHLPSAKFTANAAWLVLAVIAFNLTRAAAVLTGHNLAKATTATIRRKLIAVPVRVASSARRVTLPLPTAWPWEQAWTELFTRVCGPPLAPVTTPAGTAQPRTHADDLAARPGDRSRPQPPAPDLNDA